MSSDRRENELRFLSLLEEIIDARIRERSEDSYVAKLVLRGDRRVAQKVGEEAVELALAAAAGEREEQIEEAADLVFHLLVLLRAKGIRLSEVTRTLAERHETDAARSK